MSSNMDDGRQLNAIYTRQVNFRKNQPDDGAKSGDYATD